MPQAAAFGIQNTLPERCVCRQGMGRGCGDLMGWAPPRCLPSPSRTSPVSTYTLIHFRLLRLQPGPAHLPLGPPLRPFHGVSLALIGWRDPAPGHVTRPRCAGLLDKQSPSREVAEVSVMWAGSVLRTALCRAPGSRRAHSALAQLRGILEEELEGIRGAGTWKSERVITSRQGPRIHVDGVSGGNSPSQESSDVAGC